MSSLALNGLKGCARCQRLQSFIARLKPGKGRQPGEYWNAPVNGFGDLRAGICLVGLAPGAHGANRTGRPFTGDGAGSFMYPLLHQARLSNQPEAFSPDDGLILQDLYITNAVKCLPPDNRPNADEFAACRPYLAEELRLLRNLRVVIALGQGAHVSLLRLFREQGHVARLVDHPFGHGIASLLPNGLWLLGSYHTSRYNVQTGRITQEMFRDLLEQAKSLAQGENG